MMHSIATVDLVPRSARRVPRAGLRGRCTIAPLQAISKPTAPPPLSKLRNALLLERELGYCNIGADGGGEAGASGVVTFGAFLV